METIKEGKEFLRNNFEKGCTCPCCGQMVRLYKRKLNSGMALFLIGLRKLTLGVNFRAGDNTMFFSNKEVMAAMNINTSSLDYSVLKHFGLIEARISEGGKKDSGYWRLTREGFNFVADSSKAPKYVFLYNNKRTGVSDEQISIQEALGEKFDYQELMNK